MSKFKLDAHTHVGLVHLTVANAERMLGFYEEVLGFIRRSGKKGVVQLGAGETRVLLQLTEDPDARPKPSGTTGLYHFAIRVPTRRDLALALLRLRDHDYPLQGASDHGVSEALYLVDPEGNGIEIYRDRPREAWPRGGDELEMMTAPLDLKELLETLEADNAGSAASTKMAPGTDIGHIHLQVGDLSEAERFYQDILGLDLMQRYGNSAAFFSAGGYHHHVAVNVWAGRGAPAPPPYAVGLRYFTLRLPDEDALLAAVRHIQARVVDTKQIEGGLRLADPAGNVVILTASPSQL
ncbi:MAG: VOC family protein [Anaerolineae bacterium]